MAEKTLRPLTRKELQDLGYSASTQVGQQKFREAGEREQAERQRFLQGVSIKAGQGASFNTIDEVAGALGGDTQKIRKFEKSFEEDYPVSSLVAEFAGSAAGPAAAAYKLLQTFRSPSRVANVAKSLGLDAVANFVYDFGREEGDIGKRAQAGAEAVAYTPITTVLGRGLESGAKYGINTTRKLTDRAKNLFNVGSPVKNQRLSTIPLTAGERTQDPRMLALERSALTGGQGENAQKLATEAEEVRRIQIEKTLNNAVGTDAAGANALVDVAENVRLGEKLSKDKYDTLYAQFDADGENVLLNTRTVREGLSPLLNAVNNQFNISPRLHPRSSAINKQFTKLFGPNKLTTSQDLKTAQGRKLLAGESTDLSAPELAAIEATKEASVDPINLKQVDNFLKDITRSIKNADEPDKAILKQYRAIANSYLDNLPKNALKSGDEKTLNAYFKAKKSFNTYSQKYRDDKIVAQIVENERPTSEVLMNLVFAGTSQGAKLRPDAATNVKNILRAAADPVEARKALAEGVIGRAMAKATKELPAAKADSLFVKDILDYKTLRNELRSIISNKSFMEEVFPDATQRRALDQTYKNLNAIVQSPTYSNIVTMWDSLARNTSAMPVPGGAFLAGVSRGLFRAVGGATNERQLAEQLKEFKLQALEQYSRRPNFAGGTAAAGMTSDNETEQ